MHVDVVVCFCSVSFPPFFVPFVPFSLAGIFIVEVVKGTPAYASKQLKAGDEVIYINNVNVTHLLLPQVLLLMRNTDSIHLTIAAEAAG